MSKLSSFFMSALLVVSCLWLNVSCFPNILESEPDAGNRRSESEGAANEPLQLDSIQDAVKSAVPSTERRENNASELNGVSPQQEEKRGNSRETQEASGDDDYVRRSNGATLMNASMVSDGSARRVLMTPSSLDRAVVNAPSATSDRELKNGSRPQGGKFVSIPSREQDAFQSYTGPYNPTNRVIATTRAEF